MWIVRLPSQPPYTFVVMSILTLAIGVLSIFRTPTDIFPNINVPVCIISSCNGMVAKDGRHERIHLTLKKKPPNLRPAAFCSDFRTPTIHSRAKLSWSRAAAASA
jgi:hypothetical protein